MLGSNKVSFTVKLIILLFVWSSVLPKIFANYNKKSSNWNNKEDTSGEEGISNESGEDESGDTEEESEMVFEGAYAPVFTPVDENNELNCSVIPEYVKYLHKSGVKGMLVTGTTGEGPTMSVSERKLLLEAYLKEARKCGLKVIAQIGGTNVPDARELARHAQEMKVDGIMTLPQLYFKPTSVVQLVEYLELISKCAPNLPIFYYDFPEMTGVEVNMRAMFQCASSRISKFMGAKASFETALELADLLRGGQKVFVSGNSIAPNALMGFDTSITTVSNMFMDQVIAIQEAVLSGDVKKACELQTRLDSISREIEAIGEEFVPLLKATMEIVTGLKMGPARPPEQRVTMEQRQSIMEIMEKYNIEVMSR